MLGNIRVWRLFFTSNRVRAWVVIRSAELYDLVKTEFQFPLSYDSVAYDLTKTRLSKLQAEAEEPPSWSPNHNGWKRELWLIYSSASALDSEFSLDRMQRSHKRSRNKRQTLWSLWLRFYHTYSPVRFLISQGLNRSCESTTNPLEVQFNKLAI